MDANNSAQSRGVFDSQLIEQVHEGMRVFDVAGKEVGRVEDVRMGDPSAATEEGQSHTMMTPGVGAVAERVGAVLGADDDDFGPKVPEPERSNMLRMGYLKIESGGIFGIGSKERYVRADMIASVAGERVTLGVPAEELPGEHGDDRPLAA